MVISLPTLLAFSLYVCYLIVGLFDSLGFVCLFIYCCKNQKRLKREFQGKTQLSQTFQQQHVLSNKREGEAGTLGKTIKEDVRCIWAFQNCKQNISWLKRASTWWTGFNKATVSLQWTNMPLWDDEATTSTSCFLGMVMVCRKALTNQRNVWSKARCFSESVWKVA